MNINTVDLTIEEARAVLADERLILAVRADVEAGESAIAERDQLRVELAEAEKRADAALAQVARLREGLDTFARAYRVSMEPFGGGIDQADGARHWLPGGWPSVAEFKNANALLAETPARSLAAVKAEALRELAAEWRGIKWSAVTFTMAESAEHFAGMAESMAIRLEREAKNG